MCYGDDISVDDLLPKPEDLPTLKEVELAHVAYVLQACEGNKSRAARILGIDRRSLYRRLEKKPC